MTAPKSATRRINNGRGHTYIIDGVKADGVTSILNGGIPKPALTRWAAKTVAEFVAERRDILTKLSDQELIDLCVGVPFRERDAAANRGTEVHAIAAKLAMGEDVEVPEPLVGRVDAYIAWEKAWQPRNVRVENVIVNRQYRYAGTFDILCEIDGMGTVLSDIKTGRSGIFAETGLQLSAYGHGEVILHDDGTEEPMPHVDTYAALWLTRDDYEFMPLDVGEADFRAFLYAQQITRWTKERAGDHATRPMVGAPLRPPVREVTS